MVYFFMLTAILLWAKSFYRKKDFIRFIFDMLKKHLTLKSCTLFLYNLWSIFWIPVWFSDAPFEKT